MSRALIVYESQNGTTETLAKAIREGLEQAGVKTDLKKSEEVAIAELVQYQALIVGAPTYHKEILPTIEPFLAELETVALKGQIGAYFGAYGWSGESHAVLKAALASAGLDVVDPGVKLGGASGADGLNQHREYAKLIAAKMNAAG
jgi:flavorubredoxin